MPKRHYPFSDSFPLQEKIRIGTREVAYGIDGMFYRNEIHAHTKELMLEGAKKLYSQTKKPIRFNNSNFDQLIATTAGDVEAKVISYYSKSSSQLPIKQHKTATRVCTNHGDVHDDKNAPHSCSFDDVKLCCNFCFCPLCSGCMQACSMCKQPYCSSCSVLSYNVTEESATCLSCKKH